MPMGVRIACILPAVTCLAVPQLVALSDPQNAWAAFAEVVLLVTMPIIIGVLYRERWAARQESAQLRAFLSSETQKVFQDAFANYLDRSSLPDPAKWRQ